MVEIHREVPGYPAITAQGAQQAGPCVPVGVPAIGALYPCGFVLQDRYALSGVLFRCGADQCFGDSCGHAVDRRSVLCLHRSRSQRLILRPEVVQKSFGGANSGEPFEADVPFEPADTAAEVLGDNRGCSLGSRAPGPKAAERRRASQLRPGRLAGASEGRSETWVAHQPRAWRSVAAIRLMLRPRRTAPGRGEGARPRVPRVVGRGRGSFNAI